MKKYVLYAIVIFTCVMSSYGYATPPVTVTDVQGLAANIHSSMFSFGHILTTMLLITGVACILSALYKFHAHYKNPNQAPLVQPVCFLMVGAALCTFPFLVHGTAKTIYGGTSIDSIGASPALAESGPLSKIITGSG